MSQFKIEVGKTYFTKRRLQVTIIATSVSRDFVQGLLQDTPVLVGSDKRLYNYDGSLFTYRNCCIVDDDYLVRECNSSEDSIIPMAEYLESFPAPIKSEMTLTQHINAIKKIAEAEGLTAEVIIS